ncbi:hypothetical protein ACL9RL_09245 [Plantibacter sp. Mn2098]|uniref:hypothetical protein n=1 Tax=Plantibacter sp. Mn2098 TaxID=3395266 RepID=UPI003BD214E6
MKAVPVEWELTDDGADSPYAVIRKLTYGRLGNREYWFRLVTWAPTSEARELIGYWRTLEDAAAAAWDYSSASRGWQHHLAAGRKDARDYPRPTARALLDHYRGNNKTAPSSSPERRGRG